MKPNQISRPLFRLLEARVVLHVPALCCAGAFALTQIAVRADVLNLPVVADTFIHSGMADNNAGGHAWFDAGRDGAGGVRRSLLRFNVSDIPAGSTITSVVLRLTIARVPPTTVNSTFDLFRLRAGWGEGNKVGNNGAPASSGEATWNARQFGVAQWTEEGAAADAETAASASALVGTSGEVAWSGAGLITDVHYWLTNASGNFGWLLVSQAEGTPRSVRGFTAREGGPGAGTLEVGFTSSPPQAPTLLSPMVVGGFFQFMVTTEAERNYSVERASALPASTWDTLTNFVGTGSPVTVRDTNNSTQRFYRAIAE